MANDQFKDRFHRESTSSDPLGLRALPELDPPEGLWNAIEQGLDARNDASPPTRPWVPYAMAASVAVMALTIALLRGIYGPMPVPEPSSTDQLVRLQNVSAALEAQLEGYRYGVVNATTADVVARLELELAWLDSQLSDSPDDMALWAERIALLGTLNQRYSQSDWRSEMMLASY
jgi:hypothetical protein